MSLRRHSLAAHPPDLIRSAPFSTNGCRIAASRCRKDAASRPMSATQPVVNIPKVFCSHRSVDKTRVRDIARKLREAGIDAWFDEWEIKPGEDIVAAMN